MWCGEQLLLRYREGVTTGLALVIVQHMQVDFLANLGASQASNRTAGKAAKNGSGETAQCGANGAGNHAQGCAALSASHSTGGTGRGATYRTDGTAQFAADIACDDLR
ncbi:hypothetical protein CSC33_1151 [Pseudomonas aeruginosa]|nr:hypothetical protein CSC33_1151 [Pseudomonas aeruginosa]